MDHFWKITVVAAAAEVSGEEEQMSIVIWGKDVGSNKTTLFPSILTVHGNKVVLFLYLRPRIWDIAVFLRGSLSSSW